MTEHKRWCVDTNELQTLNPFRARDLVVRCFYEARSETFALPGTYPDVIEPPEKLMEMVRDEVKTAFAEVGGDYFRPTLDSLTQVATVLGRNAASRGTPSEVIEHHKGEVRKILHMLAIRSGSRQHTLQA